MKTKYYSFLQNNSWGYLIELPKKGIAHQVFIQSKSREQAIEIAEELGIYFDGVATGIDCPCCGDRWKRTPKEFNTVVVADWIKSATLIPLGQSPLVLRENWKDI